MLVGARGGEGRERRRERGHPRRVDSSGFRRTVPTAPSMVPTQLKMLSPSGNALMPASALVWRGEARRGNEGEGQ